jgi:indole-3-glycerol phosphate synthase
MNPLINKILENKREEIAASKAVLPLEDLKIKAGENDGDIRPFSGGLRECGSKHKIIAEVKRVSPGTGFSRMDFDPVAIGKGYQKSGAGAISVLTDYRFFGGSLNFLVSVRNAVSLPILRKDFILDIYQVYEARAYGADAILIMAINFESKLEIADLCGTADELGMDVLFEVHTEDDLGMIPETPVLVGINNRDFRSPDLDVDLDTTRRLLPLVGNSKFIVCESGIRDASVMAELEGLGVDAFLIGSAFMEADDPGTELRSFLKR